MNILCSRAKTRLTTDFERLWSIKNLNSISLLTDKKVIKRQWIIIDILICPGFWAPKFSPRANNKSVRLWDSASKLLGGAGPQLEPKWSTSLRNIFPFPRPIWVQRALAEIAKSDLYSRGPFPAEAKPLFFVRKFSRSRSFLCRRRLLACSSVIQAHQTTRTATAIKKERHPKSFHSMANPLASE